MSSHTGSAVPHHDDAAHLEHLGYKQELNRVLGFFDNFSVAFSYLSPMVGVYSLFVLGVGTAGPRYLWLMIPVVGFMLLVALVFGELGSHYPLAGALYQYGKRNVGPGFGWWVGWIYGLALLVTVASVDTGVIPYLATLVNNLAGTHIDPTTHSTILLITVLLIAIQTLLNTVGAQLMSKVSRIGVYVETIGTFGVAIALAIAGFHHGLGFLFSSEHAETGAGNPLGVSFGGHWLTGAALVAVLAHAYIFYGFESAGDIAEETKSASRIVPRAMRSALMYGGGVVRADRRPAARDAVRPQGVCERRVVRRGSAGHPRPAPGVGAGLLPPRRLRRLLLLWYRRAGRGLAARVLLRP